VRPAALLVKKPRCPRDAKQRGRNREEAESNVIKIPKPLFAVKANIAIFTIFFRSGKQP
jgi:hypothetical protein